MINPWKLTRKEANDLLEELKNKQNVLAPMSSDEYNEAIKDEAAWAKFEEAKREYKLVGEALAARPEFFKAMRCWMVDAHGTDKSCNVTGLDVEKIFARPREGFELTEVELTNEDPAEPVDELRASIRDLVNKQGPLAKDVQEFMSSAWLVTDRGGGCSGWHVGAHCTYEEALELTTALRDRYQSSIDHGLLRIDVHFWGFKHID